MNEKIVLKLPELGKFKTQLDHLSEGCLDGEFLNYFEIHFDFVVYKTKSS